MEIPKARRVRCIDSVLESREFWRREGRNHAFEKLVGQTCVAHLTGADDASYYGVCPSPEDREIVRMCREDMKGKGKLIPRAHRWGIPTRKVLNEAPSVMAHATLVSGIFILLISCTIDKVD